ncbi:MAG: hypothetical protein JSU63_13990, partial [Phycisphaerales bacterium]
YDGNGENKGTGVHNNGLQAALANPQGVCACDGPPVPAVSEWGPMVSALLLLTVGAVVISRLRRSAQI